MRDSYNAMLACTDIHPLYRKHCRGAGTPAPADREPCLAAVRRRPQLLVQLDVLVEGQRQIGDAPGRLPYRIRNWQATSRHRCTPVAHETVGVATMRLAGEPTRNLF